MLVSRTFNGQGTVVSGERRLPVTYVLVLKEPEYLTSGSGTLQGDFMDIALSGAEQSCTLQLNDGKSVAVFLTKISGNGTATFQTSSAIA